MTFSASRKPASSNWLVPIFAAITFATNFSMPSAGMPVLFKEISTDLYLSVIQIGSVWGIVSLGSILVMPVGGILCDRIGYKRTIIILSLLGGILDTLLPISCVSNLSG
jgi:MFS family permease